MFTTEQKTAIVEYLEDKKIDFHKGDNTGESLKSIVITLIILLDRKDQGEVLIHIRELLAESMDDGQTRPAGLNTLNYSNEIDN